MSELTIHPGLVLILGALVLPWLRGGLRSIAIVALPLVVLALVWRVPDGPAWQTQFLDHEINRKDHSLRRARVYPALALRGSPEARGPRHRPPVPFHGGEDRPRD